MLACGWVRGRVLPLSPLSLLVSKWSPHGSWWHPRLSVWTRRAQPTQPTPLREGEARGILSTLCYRQAVPALASAPFPPEGARTAP